MSDDTDKPTPTASRDLVAALRAHVLAAMKPRFQQLISEMTDHLFTISGSAQLTSEQRTTCFESFSMLKTQNRAVNERLLEQLDAGFAHLSDPAPNQFTRDRDDGELDLVNIEEFEDRLAIDKIVKAGSERYWLPWEAIVLRVAQGLGSDPKTLTLPFSIRSLCDSYRHSIEPLGLERFVVGELDRAFARNMLPELGNIYTELGSFLAKRGLLPNIEQELEHNGSKLAPKPAVTPATTRSPAHAADSRSAESQHRPPSGADSQGAGFGVGGGPATGGLRQYSGWLSDGAGASASKPLASAQPMDTASDAGAAPMTPSSPMPAGLVDAATLFAAPSMTHNGPSFLESDAPLVATSPLDDIAAEIGQTDYLPGRGSTGLGHVLDAAVLERLQSGSGYGGEAPLLSPQEIRERSSQLAADIATLRQQGVVASSREGSLVEQLKLDTLGAEAEPLRASVQLVENLYGTFRDALNIGEGMADSIDLLKLPLAELALTDPAFLQNREHPARLLVERLGELTALSPDNNPRMEQKVGDILRDVNEQFAGDLSVFGQALTQVTELALGLLRQQQRNIQRQVASEEGRAKRSVAAARVERLLQSALPDREIASPLLAVIDNVLRDHWVLAAVRGLDDAALARQVNVAKTVHQALQAIVSGAPALSREAATGMVAQLRDGLDDAALIPPEQVAQFDAVLAALVGQNSVAMQPSTIGFIDTFAEPGFSERLEQLPRLRRWVRRARELELSTWVVQKLPDGKQRNLQLIWRDDALNHFAFANEQGQKVREVNVVQLAHWLSNRLTPLAPADRLSIVERSVFSTLAQKQSDLAKFQEDGDDNGLSRGQLIDKAQSMLRRARRKGPSHSAIAVHVEGPQAPIALQAALEQAGLNVIARGTLSASTQGIIIDSAETDQLQQALREGLTAQGDAGIGIAAIDPEYDSADELWRALEDTAKRGLALSPNTGVLAEREVRPTDLAGAVRTTYERLRSDMPPRLSLRRVLRTRTHDHSQIEEAFQILLDGMPDAGGEMARSAGYHSAALSIALDYIKVSSACRIAEDLTTASRAVPVFNIRLSTDAALHHDFLEFVLNEVSESGIGTDRLCLEFRDSSRLREESRVADFARTLRSIGCLIAVCDVNPARGSTAQLQVMNPHVLALDTSLWPPSEDDRLTPLHQAISDLHHLVGEHVVLRDNRERDKAAQLGIDFVEFFDPEEIDPPGLAEHLPALQR